jgi:hypothetical protein
MPNNDRPRPPLEAFVHRALRELPAERAPADLEARVLAALQARRQLPWWQAGWRAWPMVPRTAVLAAACSVTLAVAWLFLAGVRSAETFAWAPWIETHAPWLAVCGTLCDSLFDTAALCLRQFQPWLLGAAVLAVGAYLALLSLGSGLYRRLLANR